MPIYYAVIPGLEKYAAEVDAPEKRKARTEYLDYLSRAKIIRSNERSSYKRRMLVDRTNPGEFTTSIKLSYLGNNKPILEPQIEEVESVPELPEQEQPMQEPEQQVSQRPSPLPTMKSGMYNMNMDKLRGMSSAKSPIANLSSTFGGR